MRNAASGLSIGRTSLVQGESRSSRRAHFDGGWVETSVLTGELPAGTTLFTFTTCSRNISSSVSGRTTWCRRTSCSKIDYP